MTKQINPIEELKFLQEYEKEIAVEKAILMEKALSSNDPGTLVKAQQIWADVTQRQDSGFKTSLFEFPADYDRVNFIADKWQNFDIFACSQT